MMQFAVNPVTGQLALLADELPFAEPIPLRFGLAYREKLDRPGPLGRRWTSALDVLIEREAGTGELIYVNAEGRKVFFFPPKDGETSRNALFKSLFLSAGADGDLVLEEDGLSYGFTPISVTEWRLAGIVDRNGNRIAFERRGPELQRLTLPSGLAIAFTNDAAGRRTAVRLVGVDGSEALLAAYAYDGGGNLVATTAFSGRTCRFTYDAAGRVAGWNDAERTDVRYDRDEQGRVVGIHTNGPFDGDRYAYDESGTRTLYWPGGGDAAALTYAIDPKIGKIIRVEDREGVRLEVEYDRHRQKILERNGEGEETHTEWDSEGRLRSTIDAEGRRFIVYHDRHGDVLFTRDPSGAKYRNTFDELGNLIAAQDPNGFVTEFKHDEAGRVVATMRHDGMMEQRAYDAHGWLADVLDYRGGRTRFARDGFGRVVAITDPLGHVTRLAYVPDEQRTFWEPSRMIRADGARISNAWSDAGARRVTSNGEGQQVWYHYGPFDLLAALENRNGGTARFVYDVLGQLAEVRNQANQSWTFERNSRGRVTSETGLDGLTIEYALDRADRLLEARYRDGSRATFTYDRSGLLLREVDSTSDGTAPLITRYGYDERGLMLSAKNGDALVVLERDPIGRIVAETINGRRIESTYDCCGNRTERRIGDHVSKHRFDPMGAIVEAVLGPHEALRFDRDRRGQELYRENGTGFRLDQSYDAIGQLLRQRSGAADETTIDRAYSWTKAYLPAAIRDARHGDVVYDHDPNGQIAAVRDGAHVLERFAYDQAHNIAASASTDGALSPWLISAGGRVAAARGPSGEKILLTYDARGRVVVRRVERDGFRPRTWRYVWNVKDQLVGCETPEGDHWAYAYDPFGRRISKSRRLSEAERAWARARFPERVPIAMGERSAVDIWPQQPPGASDASQTPAIGTHYLWDGHTVVEEAPLRLGGIVDQAAASRWHYEPSSFRPLAKETADGRCLHIVTDHVGTPRELVSASGEVRWAARYHAWGGMGAIWSPANDDGPAQAPHDDCPIRFQGQWADAETGLLYNRFRHYDPLSAHYVSRDAIGFAGGLRLFGYVVNPLAFVDPLGLACNLNAPVGQYGSMNSVPGSQLNHLSQDAAFGSVIPQSAGLATPLEGSVTDLYGQHWGFHSSLDQFWAPYMPGGSLEGSFPTVGQYNQALTSALQSAGLPPAVAGSLTDQAAAQQLAYGLGPNDPVPNIPQGTGVKQTPAAKASKTKCRL